MEFNQGEREDEEGKQVLHWFLCFFKNNKLKKIKEEEMGPFGFNLFLKIIIIEKRKVLFYF